MKKNITKFLSVLLIAIFCLTAFVGCSAGLDLPNSDAVVSGNGGLAVKKGDYIYFVNGYQSISNLKTGDNLGGNTYSAIYRTKLENGEIAYNEDGTLKNCDLIVDKVCGFEKTALYIFGDYIYFATPNTEKVISSSSLSSNFELTDFYRAKLDGSNRTLIYKTSRTSDKTAFAFYKTTTNSDVKLAIFDGESLSIVNCANKEVKVVCDSVSTVALPNYSDYNIANNQISLGASNVYYTRASKDEDSVDSGNLLCYAKLDDGVEHIIEKGNYTYEVKSATNEYLLFTKKSSYNFSANNFVIKYAYEDGELLLDTEKNAIQLDSTGNTDVLVCTFEQGNQAGIVIKNESNKLAYMNLKEKKYEVLNDNIELTPICIYGSKVYAYSSDNSIYQIDYKTKEQKILLNMAEEENEFNKPYFSANKNYSVLAGSIFYFAEYKGESETGYYLNVISTASQDTYEAKLLGVVLEKHIVVEEEE